MVNQTDITVVVQGAVCSRTKEALLSAKKHLPDSHLILSTWSGSNLNGLEYDELVLSEDPGFHWYSNQPNGKKNNVNRQIISTFNGLRRSETTYSLKIRSDFVLTGHEFLKYFNQFTKSDQRYRVFEKKILSCVFFARDPRWKNSYPFHPSDIAFFGLTTDLLNLFDVPLMTQEESTHCKYVPEQHLWINCLIKNGHKIDLKHQKQISKKIIEDTEKYAVSNFLHLDWEQFNLSAPKHLRDFDQCNLQNVITYVEWQRLYQKYLDPKLILPKRDHLREFLQLRAFNTSSILLLAKICTTTIGFGKFLKNTRRRVREKIIKFLTIYHSHLPDKLPRHFRNKPFSIRRARH